MSSNVIFSNADVIVRANFPVGPAPSTVVVTFSPMLQARRAPGDGFAEAALNKRGIASVVFVAQRNHWWQAEAMDDALAAANTRLAGATRVIGYGSSMGAYGALLFSRRLPMTDVYALGPQFSIDRRKVPFERRWGAFARSLRFRFDDMNAELCSPARKYVFYDNKGTDRPHIDLMQGTSLFKVALPHAGHAVGSFFKEVGLLSDFFTEVCRGGDMDALGDVVREARRRRGRSVTYKMSLLASLDGHEHHLRTYASLMERFLGEHRRNYKLLNRAAELQLRFGNAARARELAESACDLNRNNYSSQRILRDALLLMGRLDEAEDIRQMIEAAKRGGRVEVE